MKLIGASKYLLLPLSLGLLISCGGGGGSSNTPDPIANLSPVISPMLAEPLLERSDFSFTVQASDSDGSISSYLWEQTSGTTTLEFAANTETLAFTLPDVESDEVLSFKLTVKDNDNASISAVIDIPVTAYSNLNTVTFTDSGLKRCLDEVVNIDLGVTSIQCNQAMIGSLSGLENFTKLEKLTLTHANIDDISTLSSLSMLKELDLSNNAIVDISSLQSLAQLSKLNLNDNVIENAITTIKQLTQLSELQLSRAINYYSSNSAIDISALDKLTELVTLNLSNAYVENTSDIANFTKLQTLQLAATNLRSLSFLLSLPDLIELDISENYIQDLSALSQLVNLSKLNLKNVPFQETDLSPISTLLNLTELNLSGVSRYDELDISKLAELVNLEKLDLGDNSNMSNFSILVNFSNLKNLILFQLQYKSLQPFYEY